MSLLSTLSARQHSFIYINILNKYVLGLTTYRACQSQTHTAVSFWPLRKSGLIEKERGKKRINALNIFSKQLAFFSLLNEDCSLMSPFFKSFSSSNFAVQLEKKRIKRKGKYRIWGNFWSCLERDRNENRIFDNLLKESYQFWDTTSKKQWIQLW